MRIKMSAGSFVRCLGVASSVIAFGALSISSAGCAAGSEEGSRSEATGTTAKSFDEWQKTVYQEPESGVWIVNGDTPVDSIEKLQAFYERYVQQGALIVDNDGGIDSKWNSAQKVNITYCVSRTSFGSRYNAVVQAMSEAGGNWASVANIAFVHDSSQDGNCNARNNKVVFDVRQVRSGQYLARAFFPNQRRSTRNVLIDSSSFGDTWPYTLAGILTHELGHALGFRHEHTRPESGACFEDDNWRALTAYDSDSVMHYPQCNGTNSGDLVITAQDAQGAAKLYGSP
ncbi:M57 family metalloprotease [Pendulispora brunnea]|uniref:M57 family metalloprotease n=1 Tax=Pendulispora brunnea TaxID=2905690 RepID=A0ABZ2K829_9BACT